MGTAASSGQQEHARAQQPTETEAVQPSGSDQTDKEVKNLIEIVKDLKRMREFYEREDKQEGMKKNYFSEGLIYQEMVWNIFREEGREMRKTNIAEHLEGCGYVELSLKILEDVKAEGIFKSQDHWDMTRFTYFILCSCSSVNEQFALRLMKSGAIEMLLQPLDSKTTENYESNQLKNLFHVVIDASLKTLHNIARCPGVKPYFKVTPAEKILKPLLKSNSQFKQLAGLILAYIQETKFLGDNGGGAQTSMRKTIKDIIDDIEKCLKNQKQEKSTQPQTHLFALTSWELADGLTKLADRPSNKELIVKEGAINVLIQMLKSDNPKDQISGAKCIWGLAFKDDNKVVIQDVSKIIAALENLAKSDNLAVKTPAEGALWELKETSKIPSRPSTSTPAKVGEKHVFISYCWNEKGIARQIFQDLKRIGYIVWLDVEEMQGQMLEKMAEAVENAAVALVFISEAYKERQHCQTEANYIYKTQTPFIPLLVQQGYRPNGWLGAFLGTRLFYDFSGKYPYKERLESFLAFLQAMLKELGDRGKRATQTALKSHVPTSKVVTIGSTQNIGTSSETIVDDNKSTSDTAEDTSTEHESDKKASRDENEPINPSSSYVDNSTDSVENDKKPNKSIDEADETVNEDTSPITGHINKSVQSVRNPTITQGTITEKNQRDVMTPPAKKSHKDMNKKDVKKWLVKHGLHMYTQGFCQADGRLLWQLKKIRNKAPVYLYATLHERFGMSFLDILKFCAALDEQLSAE